jgi:hypothetical protein
VGPPEADRGMRGHASGNALGQRMLNDGIERCARQFAAVIFEMVEGARGANIFRRGDRMRRKVPAILFEKGAYAAQDAQLALIARVVSAPHFLHLCVTSS